MTAALKICQSFCFTAAILLLSILNFFENSIEFKRPVVLLTASVFALFIARTKELSIIQRIILLYIIEMFFNQLSERVFHVQTFSISLSLIAIVPLAVSFICYRFHKPHIANAGANGLFNSWGIVFAIIILHMMFLFPLLKNIYGYGYDRDFAILANICLYFLVFAFSWQQLEQINFRRIAAIIFVISFMVIKVKGL